MRQKHWLSLLSVSETFTGFVYNPVKCCCQNSKWINGWARWVGRGGLDGGGRRVLLVAFNGGYLFGVQQYNLNRTSVIAS